MEHERALKSQVRIFSTPGILVGGGVLISQDTILTCAHVVASALGLPKNERAQNKIPSGEIKLKSLGPSPIEFSASILQWDPDDNRDWALLKVNDSSPTGCWPAKMYKRASPSELENLSVYGFPKIPSASPQGYWAKTGYYGADEFGKWQLTALDVHNVKVQQGYSGCPVWDDKTGQVIGIILQTLVEYNTAFMRSVDKIPTLESYLKQDDDVSLPAQVDKQSRQPLLNCDEWLKLKGLPTNPFSFDSFQAETDPFLQRPKQLFSAYVDFGRFEDAFNYAHPFVIMNSGAGKTALCKRILNAYVRKNQDTRTEKKTLVVYYQPKVNRQPVNHLKYIYRETVKELGITAPQPPSEPDEIIEKICEMACSGPNAYTDLRILVDPIARYDWENLARLATLPDVAYRNEQVLFQFFITPQAFKSLQPQITGNLPGALRLEISRDLALEALQHRFRACLTPSIRDGSINDFFDFSWNPEHEVAALGVTKQSFRAMWQFGHALLESHFGVSGKAPAYSRISNKTFQEVKNRLLLDGNE